MLIFDPSRLDQHLLLIVGRRRHQNDLCELARKVIPSSSAAWALPALAARFSEMRADMMSPLLRKSSARVIRKAISSGSSGGWTTAGGLDGLSWGVKCSFFFSIHSSRTT